MHDKLFDAQALLALRRVTSVTPSPCGTWLAVSAQRLDSSHQASFISDLWRVPLDPDQPPLQLTRGEHQDTSPTFDHRGHLLFLSDRPNPELGKGADQAGTQVWRLNPQGGEAAPVTDEPLGVSTFVCAKNTDVLVVRTSMLPDIAHDKQRETRADRAKHGPSARLYHDLPVRHWDHWRPVVETHIVAYNQGQRTLLLSAPGVELQHAPLTISHDGQTLVTCALTPNTQDRIHDTRVLKIDTTSAQTHLLAHVPRCTYSAPVLSSDCVALSRKLRHDGRHGGLDLVTLDLQTGEERVLATGQDLWLIPQAFHGDHLICTAEHQGDMPVYALSLSDASPTPKRITATSQGGTHYGVHALTTPGQETLLCGVRSTTLHPPDPFVVPLLEEASPRFAAEISGGAPDVNVTITKHTVTSTDGTQVPYTVLQPQEAETHAALLWIHGGPINQWGDVWHWRWNPLIGSERGYTMVLPNPRGSTGLGLDFVEGIWGNTWGGQCYEDLMVIADEVAARPGITHNFAMGGSFGGYMTNWIGTQTGRFDALVTHASISDLHTFHGVTDHPSYWEHALGVELHNDRTPLTTYSPLHHVSDAWTSPTLLIHGERDFRTPVGESLALFEALRHHDIDARLLIFPDENHWILKPRNIRAWYQHVFDFLDEHSS